VKPGGDVAVELTRTQDGTAQDSSITLEIFGATDAGRVRRNNEDAFTVADALTGSPIAGGRHNPLGPVLLAVSDGLGGELAGEVASALTVETLRSLLGAHLPSGNVPEALRTAIAQTNDTVMAAAEADDRIGMGATLVAVVVQEGRAFIATVGDSRAYVFRSGQLVQVTKDQTLLQWLMDNDDRAFEEMRSYVPKNVVTQSIGRAGALTIPVGCLELRRGDRILLCSDGLSGEVSDDTIGRILGSNPPAIAVSRLIEAANAAGGSDNVTIVVAHVCGEVLAEPAEPVLATLRSVPPAASPDPASL
jgi:PPM family protein phosphatase